MGRLHSENYGVTVIPTFRLIDSQRGVIDLDNKDFNAARDDLEYLFNTYEEARIALARGDDSMLFPGFTLPMLRGEEANPMHKAAHRSRLANGEVQGADPYAHEGADATKIHLFKPEFKVGSGSGSSRGGSSSGVGRGGMAARLERERAARQAGMGGSSSGGGGGGGGGVAAPPRRRTTSGGRGRGSASGDDDDGWSILGDDGEGGKRRTTSKGRRTTGGNGNRVQ